jgi:hypothetical protein
MRFLLRYADASTRGRDLERRFLGIAETCQFPTAGRMANQYRGIKGAPARHRRAVHKTTATS